MLPHTDAKRERNNAAILQSLRHHSAIFAIARHAGFGVGAGAVSSQPRGRYPGTRLQGQAIRQCVELACDLSHAVGCHFQYR